MKLLWILTIALSLIISSCYDDGAAPCSGTGHKSFNDDLRPNFQDTLRYQRTFFDSIVDTVELIKDYDQIGFLYENTEKRNASYDCRMYYERAEVIYYALNEGCEIKIAINSIGNPVLELKLIQDEGFKIVREFAVGNTLHNPRSKLSSGKINGVEPFNGYVEFNAKIGVLELVDHKIKIKYKLI